MPTPARASLKPAVTAGDSGEPRQLDADVAIIGSGIGGACMAAALAPGGAKIVILERGEQLRDCNQARDETAIFADGFFRPDEFWRDENGARFNPGNYHYVGGNSKFYGAAMLRLREADFGAVRHLGGRLGNVSPAWPIDYAALAPWYRAAEKLFQVRGDATADPTEPPRDAGDDYDHPPVADEPAVADLRRRLTRAGVTPAALPLAVDIDAWLARAATPWDSFPDTTGAKLDAETAPLAAALRHDNVTLVTGARAVRLLTGGGNSITAVEYARAGETKRLRAKVAVLSAGAIHSAALLLRSANKANPAGLANSSRQVGRNLMNHHASALLAICPWRVNDSVYQKTLHFNDFYLRGGPGGAPLGNVQLLGKLSGGILAAQTKLPQQFADWTARRAFGWYAITEDLPHADNRVTIDAGGDDGEIRIAYRRTNWRAHRLLVARAKAVFRRAGFPLTLSRAFDFRAPSHQCGTTRFGDDPADSVLDPFCRAYDHPNLFVVDAGFMPSSAAVNPALTVAAQALRAGDHLRARLEAGGAP